MDQMLPIPGPELPKPERVTPPQDSGEFVLSQPDTIAAPTDDGERLSQAASAVAQITSDPAALTLAQPALPVVDPLTQATNGQSSNPVIADDADVIEKEWVEKAKHIVSKTRDNPHEQSAELTSFKHDYIKKRYGRELRLPDDQMA